MLEPVRQHAEGKGLGLGNRLIPAGAVNQNPGQLDDFADPAAVGFAFQIYGEVAHGFIVQRVCATATPIESAP
ncbi:MAG TPA: hypothetical protein VFP80_06225 [Thermoanaerobaculia bacterium]|nr:hypothetical protein [Thermoanaerobaculia bacterium]